jgi:hypothetical protein
MHICTFFSPALASCARAGALTVSEPAASRAAASVAREVFFMA